MAKKTPSRSKPTKGSSGKRESTGTSEPVPASQEQQQHEQPEDSDAPTPPVAVAKVGSSTASVPAVDAAALSEAKSNATLPPPEPDSDDDGAGAGRPEKKDCDAPSPSASSASSEDPDASDDNEAEQVPVAPSGAPVAPAGAASTPASTAAVAAPIAVEVAVEPRPSSPRQAWTIDDVIGAAGAVLGTDAPDAPNGEEDFASSSNGVTTVPLCFFGLHPLGLGNFTQPAGTEVAHPPPQNFAAAAHVVVLKCGHLACASCFATALAESSVSEEMDGGSRIALTASCPVCDAAATLTVSNATPQSDVAGRWVGAMQAITAHLPRLIDDEGHGSGGSRLPAAAPSSAAVKKASAHVTEAAAVAGFVSKLLSALERRVATASQADALGRSPDESASVAGGASVTVCGICEEDAEVARCHECGFGLCDGCLSSVHSKGRFKRHTVTRIDASSASQRVPTKRTRAADPAAASSASRAMCPEHSDYPVELCCYDCGVCICLRCHYNGSHKGHSTAPLADLHGSLAAAFRTNAEHLGRCATAVAKLSAEVATAIDAADSEARVAKEMTAAAYADARRVLDEGQADATAQIDLWLRRRNGALSHDLAEARRTAGSLAMASVGIRSVLRDTSTQAIASLVRQRETITKRTGALAQSSVFVEEAISAVRDSMKKPGPQKKEKPSTGDKKGKDAATPPAPAPEEQLAVRAASLLRAQSAGASLRFFAEPAVPKTDGANRAAAQLRQGVDVAVARLLAQSASDHAVHWAADPAVRLADRLRGASIAVAPSGPAMPAVEDAATTSGKAKKSVKIADGNGKKRSTSPQASSASKSSRRTSAGLSIGSLLDLGSTRRAAALDSDADDDDADDTRRDSRGGRRVPAAPYAANEEDDDDDEDGAQEAEMMPRPDARGTGRPGAAGPPATDEFDFTTQEGGARGGARGGDGGRREETEKRLQVMASQWTDGPASKSHRSEPGGGSRSAPVAPPTTGGSRGGALDFGPAGALRRARARPLAGNNGGNNGASSKPDGSGFNLRI